MMIRRFAGNDRKLVELYKPTLTISTRRRSPRGILYIDDFYRDRHGDFDEELLDRVEQHFARHYPTIADCNTPGQLCGDGGAALISWIATMLVRTRLHQLSCLAVAEKNPSIVTIGWRLAPDIMSNIARNYWYSELQDLLSRPQMCWKTKTYAKEDVVVITDHPVCQTSGLDSGGQVTIVPLTKTRVLFGGRREAVERWNVPVDVLNAYLAGWAERSIFAATSDALKSVVKQMKGEGSIQSDDWCDIARKPFLGFFDRLNGRTMPDDIDVSKWWDEVKDSYGESILPWIKDRDWGEDIREEREDH